MKINIKIFILPSLLALILHACQPKDYKTIGIPVENIGALTGTWKLTKVTQTDEDALRKGFPYTTMDLTTVFPYTDFKFTLNADGTTPTTFSTVPGNSPKIIRLTSGKWMVDDPAYPKVVSLINGTDTAKVTLGSYPTGANATLKLRLEKRDASTGKLLISYSYEFAKQ